MRVGVVILPQFSWPEARARWASLQERGFAHGWTYDHLSWRDLKDEPWFGTLPTLVAAATATSTLRLGTWVMSPNYRHPVTTAKDLMTLDDVSGGRLIAAVGAGGTGWDATVLGQPPLTPRQRVARLAEFVTLTDLLLTQADTTWDGEYFHAAQAKMIPAGSRSRIELVVAGNGPKTIGLAARTGDGWATTGPESSDLAQDLWWARVAGLARTFEDAAAAAGRDPAALRRYLNLDSAPELSIGSLDAFTDAAGRAAELGFTDVVVHWPRPDGVYAGDDAVLDRIAASLTGGTWTGR
jgi:alkanesulfonate monooxygenase SsuD/methylene tetrahydromethanopterin reductase-like flavin-dependent oxidoreductase (luciferase family)